MVQVSVACELASVEEALTKVADGALDLALGLGAVGPACPWRKAPVGGKAQELAVLDERSSFEAQITRDDGPHLVEEDLSRHAAEEGKGLLEAAEDRPHVLAIIEAHPKEARVAEHDQERIAHAPGQAHMGKVDLSLVGGRRLEAQDGLGGWTGPDRSHEVLDPGVAARISGRPYLLEEADGGELRIGGKTGKDHRLVGIQLVRDRRAGPVAHALMVQVPVQLPVTNPAIDRIAADAEFSGEGALGEALFEVVPEQHSLLSLGQARLHMRREGAKVKQSLGARSTRARARCQVSDFQPPKVSDLQPPATNRTDSVSATGLL